MGIIEVDDEEECTQKKAPCMRGFSIRGYSTDFELDFVQECHLWWSKHAGFLDLLIMVSRCLIAGETLQRGFPRRCNRIKIVV